MQLAVCSWQTLLPALAPYYIRPLSSDLSAFVSDRCSYIVSRRQGVLLVFSLRRGDRCEG